MYFAPQRRAIFGHRNVQKWPEPFSFFYILTYEHAWLHSGVPFFEIVTSKIGPALRFFVHFDLEIVTSIIGPALRCFVHFDLEMFFASQRCAIFSDRNFQNGSEAEMFCASSLENALRATAVCHF